MKKVKIFAQKIKKACSIEQTVFARDPRKAGRLCGERRSIGMSEVSPLGGTEGYEDCDDAVTRLELAIAPRQTAFAGDPTPPD